MPDAPIEILTDRQLPLTDGCVLSLGNFDGVHIGHAKLIKTLASEKHGKKAVVFTFAEHPRNLLDDDRPVKYIIGSSDKMKYLGDLGADAVYFADFGELRDFSPERFVGEIVTGLFNPSLVVCGENFTFGKSKSGDSQKLYELLSERGIRCLIIPPVLKDGVAVSSTLIRSLIAAGDVESAERYLGRPYSIMLPVVHGREIGRTIGVPTINQLFPCDRITPKYGVYACVCEVEGRLYNGIANVGVRPTLSKTDNCPVCETHIFEFGELLYDHDVRVIFQKLLREEKRFASLAELKTQIYKDIENCITYFAQK